MFATQSPWLEEGAGRAPWERLGDAVESYTGASLAHGHSALPLYRTTPSCLANPLVNQASMGLPRQVQLEREAGFGGGCLGAAGAPARPPGSTDL